MTNNREFDFIIVGSGAGGGPLAARLAQRGFKVLVLEAGPDHLATPETAEVSSVPGFHGLSTEHPDLSWEFWVKHYDNPPAGKDPKCHPQKGDKRPLENIWYPRSSGIGGCTVHNAMITIAGPDSDWEDIADFVGDDSWRGPVMRGYFQRLENNGYYPIPKGVPTKWWGRTRDLVKWLFGFTPDHARGKHGFTGWLHTSVADVSLGLHDKQLITVLSGALWQARFAGLDRAWTLVSRFLKGQVVAELDPNHSRTQSDSPEGLVLVPIAVCGERTTIHQSSETPFVMRGHRSSPREFLLQVRQSHPNNLEVWTDCLATHVIFEEGPSDPRAIGVGFRRGRRLYRARRPPDNAPDPHEEPGKDDEVFVAPGGEVILAGGAFNTPQLLMLSGIGDQQHLADIARAAKDDDGCVMRGRKGEVLRDAQNHGRRVDLPGVGQNLQDRYEVTLINEFERNFPILEGATFRQTGPGTPDRHLKEWRDNGTGLYTSNGAVLGIFKRSKPDLEQPDLFIFGLPLPFRGYDLGYSGANERNQFTWAILKGHTRNSDGVVRLKTLDPLDTPDINFHYFNEVSCPPDTVEREDPDLTALVHGVRFVRGIRRRTGWIHPPKELHPGEANVPSEDEQSIKDWIRREAWGHHACGTCRMGPAGDPNAVLDSRFRVRGVDNLRVVDASIFPRIPGYFIVTNLYMASEKAADVIQEDHRFGGADALTYPRDLRKRECDILETRRDEVPVEPNHSTHLPAPCDTSGAWSEDVTGLALSGGGVRSATFNLGVLQALASGHWLRKVDFMSTVSGGGYIGSFLGRWFDQLRPRSEFGGEASQPKRPAADRIEHDLIDPDSPAIRWLRKHGNYIAPTGKGDARYNAAVFLRNFVSVHFVVGLLLFSLFGLANLVRYWGFEPTTALFSFAGMSLGDLPVGRLLQAVLGVFFSPWFILFELIVLFLIVPRIVAYWIVSQDEHGRYDAVPLFAALFIAGLSLFLAVRARFSLPFMFIGLAILASLIHVEMAWRRGKKREEAIGRGNVETQRLRTRNYLTHDLGLALVIAANAFAFAVIDTVGHGLQQWAVANHVYSKAFLSLGAAAMAVMPLARMLANMLAGDRTPGSPSRIVQVFRAQITAGLLAAVLFFIPLVLISFTAHAVFQGGLAVVAGAAATLVAALLTIIFAHPNALAFVNRSSLAQTYAARLARAYLGAANPLRYRPRASNVSEVIAGDDVASIRDYKPYETGGPLHLINMTVNQTVDFSSQRGNRDRKGDNVAVSSIGMSVGELWHSAWDDGIDIPRIGDTRRKRPTRLTPIGHPPGMDHPLVDVTGQPSNKAEMVSLRQWMAISGAAFGPAAGQATKVGTSLLFGLANLRTGYWWNCGINAAARDGFPPLTPLRRLYYVLEEVFLTQSLLLAEWIARFPGPWQRFWYLSDGGHFEVLGAYELIRRRVPRIIICDASADPRYRMESMANLMRKARIDFAADIQPVPESDPIWAQIPPEARQTIGTLDQLRPTMNAGKSVPAGKHAALFWVNYETAPSRRSLLLYLKANLTGDEDADVRHYQETHPEFPHEPTEDQFFDEEQWESYRRLGEHAMSKLCGVSDPRWFWSIPLS